MTQSPLSCSTPVPTQHPSAVDLLIERLTVPGLADTCAAQSASRAVVFNGWADGSLYAGQLGTALTMLIASDRSDGAEVEGRTLLVRALRGSGALDPHGLSSSAAAALAVLAMYAHRDDRYLPALERQIAKMPDWGLSRAAFPPEGGTRFDRYDLVSGTAGTALALAQVARLHPRLLPGILEQELTRLGAVLAAWLRPGGPDGSPTAFISPGSSAVDDLDERYPDGHLNLGLAHGVAGLMSSSAAVLEVLPSCSEAHEAVTRSVALLAASARRDGSSLRWPSTRARPGGRDISEVPAPDRMAWCYGTAGVAAALSRAADALEDEVVGELALAGARTVAHRYMTTEARPASPTLCHGLAGVLVCLDAVRRTSPDPLLDQAVHRMAGDLEARTDPELPLGLQDVDATSGVLLDDPSLLTGTGGVALALMSAHLPSRPQWYPLMGI